MEAQGNVSKEMMAYSSVGSILKVCVCGGGGGIRGSTLKANKL